jgi:hypothetical protein
VSNRHDTQLGLRIHTGDRVVTWFEGYRIIACSLNGLRCQIAVHAMVMHPKLSGRASRNRDAL